VRTQICAAWVCAAAALAAGSAGAQSPRPDSLPFRRGQWGAQLGMGRGPALDRRLPGDRRVSLAALRFSGPRAAWVLDAAFGVIEHRERRQIVDADGVVDRPDATSTTMIAVRVGRRRYRAATPRAAAYYTLGLVATAHVLHLPYADAPDPFYITAGAGPFADVGGTYLVTRRLGVGASLGTQAIYGRSWDVHAPSDSRHDFLRAELGAARVEVTVFF